MNLVRKHTRHLAINLQNGSVTQLQPNTPAPAGHSLIANDWARKDNRDLLNAMRAHFGEPLGLSADSTIEDTIERIELLTDARRKELVGQWEEIQDTMVSKAHKRAIARTQYSNPPGSLAFVVEALAKLIADDPTEATITDNNGTATSCIEVLMPRASRRHLIGAQGTLADLLRRFAKTVGARSNRTNVIDISEG